jgi:hypothetical protein
MEVGLLSADFTVTVVAPSQHAWLEYVMVRGGYSWHMRRRS